MRNTIRLMKIHAALYVMLIPVIIYFLVFVYYPLVRGVQLSFQADKLFGPKPYVGWDNYVTAWHDPEFWQVVRNTLIIGVGSLVAGFLPPIIIAVALNELLQITFKKFVQTVVYLPHLFSWVVIGGIWIYLLTPSGGLVNEIIKRLGGTSVGFLTDPTWARAVMILLPVWKGMGFAAIIYLASITSINPTLYEAARIDGANRFQQIYQITIPLLVPTMKVVLILDVLGLLRTFDQIYVMRNAVIQSKIDVLMVYVFDTGITNFKLGFASAVSVMVLVATLIITAITTVISRYEDQGG